MSVLSVVLVSAPCMAAEKAKATATAGLKSKPLSTEPASAKPAKSTKSTEKKTTTVASATDKPAKSTKAAATKPAAKGTKATALADASDSPAKKTTGKPAKAAPAKATQVADATTKTSKKTARTTTLASAAPAKPLVASAAKPAPKPVVVAVAAPAPETPVIMNAAPVPYGLVKAEAPRTPATPLDAPLSAADAALYRTAFDQIDSGDYDEAEATLAQVTDRSLLGYAEFHKLFRPGYTSTYDELMSWLNAYGDQPMAMRVWALAKRKKPDGAPDPAFPSLVRANGLAGPQALAVADSGGAVQLASFTTLSDSTAVQGAVLSGPTLDPTDNDLTPKSARSAYNNGQLEQAVKLGRKIGDHWVAGLALWRLGRFDQAEAEFKFVSTDPSRNAWSKSAGAYWAGRSALRQGQKDQADTYFKIAASFPFTFYGLVAEARLGVVPAVAKALKGESPTYTDDARDALTASLDSDFSWARSDVKAQRLNALIQIGRTSDAQAELQTAIQTAGDGTERDKWLALAARTNVPVSQLKPTDRLFDPSRYPIPDFRPKGGFTVDRALVYAFARKESKFNPNAYSYSGAYGLLQLMPGTAALVEGDPSFTSQPKRLLKPEINLSVGQHYIQRLSDSQIVSGDLLRTIAAYNAGPRPVKDAVDSLGDNADSLLVMESIPVAQTRQYVEEVAANYWIYRQLMGQSSKTLAMAATDARIIDASADH